MSVVCAPRSGPARPEHLKDRSISAKVVSSATMGNPLFSREEVEVEDMDRTSVVESTSRPLLKRSQTVPAERAQAYRFLPPPLRTQAWSEPPAENFQVRGKTYAKDRIKVQSEPAAFRLFAVDLVNTKHTMDTGMCAHPEERVQLALQRELETGLKELPDFVFCVNLCVPGATTYHSAYYFGADRSCMDEIRNLSTPFGRVMNQFLYGDSDEFRNRTFKLIPRIVDGNYIVRKAVGSKPAILGRKIKQYYVRSERFMEVIVDISSDPIAQRITKLCMGYLQSMVVDMMFLLEGNNESELPERIFGGVRLSNVDFKEQDGKRTITVVD